MDIPIPAQEGDIPVPAPPLSSTAGYGGGGGGHGHMLGHHHHHHHDPTSHHINDVPGNAINGPMEEQHPHHQVVVAGYNNKNNNNGSTNGSSNKVTVRYRECLKNHAAAMGGTAMDGCGEFMPSGEEGTIEALNCSACGCHRNFHRKEVEGGGGGGGHDLALDQWYHHHHHSPPHLNRVGRKVLVGHPHHKNVLGGHEAALLYPTGTLIASRTPTPHQMILPYSMAGSLPSESDEQDQDDAHHIGGGGGGIGGGAVTTSARPTQMVKKRFRTKFTQEQKEKMLSFAEKVGWKIQRQEESVVQQFCQEIGVKRRVLKVWMHNNKHNLAKKNLSCSLNHSPTSNINISDTNNVNP
ncbi:hypothetical protein CDL15_Pgr027619 [Punica granatum]|uniref:ZF-HD dimerization-type domain-containing protein n=1 Tax=Punica granatum TaxID=22663 RepID=A0A218XKI9_PUNGR|nr:hypothetical protein CDL15_Pgr027619 [Punica granatum]PKI74936.1 hypothetical protein CRG98_004708 [Punica granatum]